MSLPLLSEEEEEVAPSGMLLLLLAFRSVICEAILFFGTEQEAKSGVASTTAVVVGVGTPSLNVE